MPANLVQLVQAEQVALNKLRLCNIEKVKLVDAFTRNFTAVETQVQELERELSTIRTELAAEQRIRDSLSLPSSMKRWKHQLKHKFCDPSDAHMLKFSKEGMATDNQQTATVDGVYVKPPTTAERAAFNNQVALGMTSSNNTNLLGAVGGGGASSTSAVGSCKVAQQPELKLIDSASIPVTLSAANGSAAATTTKRSALSDFAVLESTNAGRVVAAVRSHARLSVLFEESAVLSVLSAATSSSSSNPYQQQGALVATALPKSLVEAQDRLLSQHAVFKAQPHWKPELIPVVFEYLKELLFPQGCADPKSIEASRETLFAIVNDYLCQPLDEMDSDMLNAFSDMAHFIHSALPQEFKIDEQRGGAVGSESAAEKRRAANPQLAKLEDLLQQVSVSGGDDVATTTNNLAAAVDLVSLPVKYRLSEEQIVSLLVVFQCNCVTSSTMAAATAIAGTFTSSSNSTDVIPSGVRCLFPFTALMEHSATPNATICFTAPNNSAVGGGGKNSKNTSAVVAKVIALRPIAAGERLSIAYSNTFAPLLHLRQRLSMTHFFSDDSVLNLVDVCRGFYQGKPRVVGTHRAQSLRLVAPIGEGGHWRRTTAITTKQQQDRRQQFKLSAQRQELLPVADATILAASTAEKLMLEDATKANKEWTRLLQEDGNDGEEEGALDATQFVERVSITPITGDDGRKATPIPISVLPSYGDLRRDHNTLLQAALELEDLDAPQKESAKSLLLDEVQFIEKVVERHVGLVRGAMLKGQTGAESEIVDNDDDNGKVFPSLPSSSALATLVANSTTPAPSEAQEDETSTATTNNKASVMPHPCHYGVVLRVKQLILNAIAIARTARMEVMLQSENPQQQKQQVTVVSAATKAMLMKVADTVRSFMVIATCEYAPAFGTQWTPSNKQGGDAGGPSSATVTVVAADQRLQSVVTGHEANVILLVALWESLATLDVEVLQCFKCSDDAVAEASVKLEAEAQEEEEKEVDRESQTGAGKGGRNTHDTLALLTASATSSWYAVVLLYKYVLGWTEHPKCIAAQLNAYNPVASMWPSGPTNVV